MKTKEEIEQLYHKYWDEFSHKYDDNLHYYSFVEGYTQCQEDIVEELKEWIEITLSAKSKLGASDSVIKALLNVKYKIESLNKQD